MSEESGETSRTVAAALDVVAAAEAWRATLVPKTSTASWPASQALVEALDRFKLT